MPRKSVYSPHTIDDSDPIRFTVHPMDSMLVRTVKTMVNESGITRYSLYSLYTWKIGNNMIDCLCKYHSMSFRIAERWATVTGNKITEIKYERNG